MQGFFSEQSLYLFFLINSAIRSVD